MESPTFTVPSTAVYYDRYTGVGYKHTAGEVISQRRAWLLQMAGASLGIVATADGTESGTIPSEGFYPVTSGNADYIVTLPAPSLGAVVALRNGGTGYELRSNNPTTVAINGGSGANAESAIPADTLVVCMCDTVTSWLCTDTATDGTVTTTEAAA